MTSPSSRMTHHSALDQSDERIFYEREILELMKKEILCPTENFYHFFAIVSIFYFFLYFLEYGFEAFKRSERYYQD